MQKKLVFGYFILFCLLFVTPSVKAQRVYVRIKPVHHVVTLRPTTPAPHYVWVDEEWVWDMRSKQYVVVEGYWTEPKRGKVWIPGHWKDTRRGSYWVEGQWRRG